MFTSVSVTIRKQAACYPGKRGACVPAHFLRHVHQQLRHAGRNHMLHRLRQKYWIIDANCTAARTTVTEFTVCRRYRGKLGQQKMADVPEERMLPDKTPFTDVGVDYFGPLEVKRGRSLHKRYGVIFTCLTSRAVHLEAPQTLDTNSCIALMPSADLFAEEFLCQL